MNSSLNHKDSEMRTLYPVGQSASNNKKSLRSYLRTHPSHITIGADQPIDKNQSIESSCISPIASNSSSNNVHNDPYTVRPQRSTQRPLITRFTGTVPERESTDRKGVCHNGRNNRHTYAIGSNLNKSVNNPTTSPSSGFESSYYHAKNQYRSSSNNTEDAMEMDVDKKPSELSNPIWNSSMNAMDVDENIRAYVVIDGANVAYQYAYARSSNISNESLQPDIQGILLAVKYFEERRCEVTVVVKDSYIKRNALASGGTSTNSLVYSDQIDALKELQSKGILMIVPNESSDDIFAIDCARRKDGFIISVDQFRDHIQRDDSLHDFLVKKERRILYSFCRDEFYPNPLHFLVKALEIQHD